MSAVISTLIVDDEPLGRELVRHMLARHPDIAIADECGDGEEALAAIRRRPPQLVFLDIKMPRVDGLTLLDRLPAADRPLIVFITAHDAYAIRAFEAHALDYLLKPFDQERFDQTIARVRQRLEQIAEARLGKTVRTLLDGQPPRPPRNAPDRIVVRENGRVSFISVAEIASLEASGNYVALHLDSGKTHLVHETMSALEQRLDATEFVRIHRSTMVSVARIKELLPHFNGEYVVVLKNGTKLKLSRSYLETARAALGLG